MKVDSKVKSWILWFLRLLGTVLFLGLILRTINAQELSRQLQTLPLWGYLSLFLLYLFNQFLTAWRWQYLLAVSGIKESLWDLTVAVLYGQTINKLLPSSIGGDSARIAFLINAHPQKKTLALSATLLDRFLAFLALFVLGFISLPFGSVFHFKLKVSLSILLALFFLGVLAIYWGFFDSMIKSIIKWNRLPEKINAVFDRFWRSFMAYRSHKGAILGALGISLLRQGLMILNVFFLFRLLSIPVTPGELLVVIPIVTIFVIHPISIGGIGVRETALAGFLRIDTESVLSFTLIRYSFIILVPLILLVDTLFLSPHRNKENSS